MKTAKLVALTALIFSQLTFNSSVYAGGASLYFSPSSGTKYVGDKFNVFIYVNSPQATNSYEVKVSASGNLIITGVTTGGTICKLFPTQPSYTATSATFQCGLPTPGYTGPNGYIGSVVVKTTAEGTGKLSIKTDSKILANDGSGTNIITSFGTAVFNIAPPPTAAPTITSPSHPDQDAWSRDNKVILNWSAKTNIFSYSFDDSPNTVPDELPEGSETTKTYENVGDGIWYFHVRAKGSGGWSGPAHYRIQIDKTPPNPFTPETGPKGEVDSPPIIAFSATDNASGIDHYEIRLDSGSWQKISAPYKLSRLSSGKHLIEIKAVDKAGNETIGKVEIIAKRVEPPQIIQPANGSTLPYSEKFIIKGNSEPNSTVEIFLDEKKIASVKANNNGEFFFNYEELLKAGKHQIYAKQLTAKNIESEKSSVISFSVDPQAVVIMGQTIPSAIVYTSLSISFASVLLILFFLILRSRWFRKKLSKSFEDLEKTVEKDFETNKSGKNLKSKVIEDIETVHKKLD